MKPYSTFSSLRLSLILLVALVSAISASSVSLKIDTVESAESSIEVSVLTEKCEGLGALQFNLSYDPAVVEPTSVESGSDLTSGMVEFSIKAPGQLGIAMVSSSPVKGRGELLKVIFKRLETDEGESTLTIADARAWDYENNTEMLVATEPGVLTLTKKSGFLPSNLISGPWKIPLMIGVGALVLLILIVAWVKRGKKTSATTSASDSSSTFFCQKCGSPHDADAQFCPKCGQSIKP